MVTSTCIANPMPNIYHYTDYRAFIRDYYNEQKREKPHFSYQYFAQKAGYRTKTFIFKVINAEKELPRSNVFRLAQAMALGKRERQYFEALVGFNQAASVQEREHYFTQLQSLGRGEPAVALRKNQFAYFSEWYTPVVRELVTLDGLGDDYRRLAKAVSPPITPRQARKAVSVLLELGLIRKAGPGRYVQTDMSITTGDGVTSLAVHKFQKQTMALAAEAIDRHSKETRDISSLTVGVSSEGFEKLRELTKEYRKRMVEIVAADQAVERVYQVNFQLFPVSQDPSPTVRARRRP